MQRTLPLLLVVACSRTEQGVPIVAASDAVPSRVNSHLSGPPGKRALDRTVIEDEAQVDASLDGARGDAREDGATNRSGHQQRAHQQRAEPPRSEQLPSGLFNPMPGGVFAGYRADTGLDLAGFRQPVYALAAGTLDYSEPGHTLWTGPSDTVGAIRLALDEPISFQDRHITHVWYAHLSELRFRQAEGVTWPIHVEGGEFLGIAGTANGSPHLHLGLLLDGQVEQSWGTYLLEDEVREVLGGYRPGERLPR